MLGQVGTCCGCSACMNICPRNAIVMKTDVEGFERPEINEEMCVHCGLCEKVCMYIEGKKDKYDIDEQKAVAFQISDEQKLFSSSSGGAFIALSDIVLNRGGVIYGAIYDLNYNVVHSRAVTKEERDAMCKSKYVQSELRDTFAQIKSDLQKDKMVMFTGTSCQCQGLVNYLGNHPKNLITCDILCHGVPSPLIWKEYLMKKQKNIGRIKSVDFRDKNAGWKIQSLIKADKKTYQGFAEKDEYLVLFFKHLILRPECHKCNFASHERATDVSIADFWGIEEFIDSLDTTKGVSLLLGNTSKGCNIIEELKEYGRLFDVPASRVSQPILEYPSKQSKERDFFWKDYEDKGYDYVEKKYGRLSFASKVIKIVIVPISKKMGIYKALEKVYFRFLNRELN